MIRNLSWIIIWNWICLFWCCLSLLNLILKLSPEVYHTSLSYSYYHFCFQFILYSHCNLKDIATKVLLWIRDRMQILTRCVISRPEIFFFCDNLSLLLPSHNKEIVLIQYINETPFICKYILLSHFFHLDNHNLLASIPANYRLSKWKLGLCLSFSLITYELVWLVINSCSE